jgi:hypothetical protein
VSSAVRRAFEKHRQQLAAQQPAGVAWNDCAVELMHASECHSNASPVGDRPPTPARAFMGSRCHGMQLVLARFLNEAVEAAPASVRSSLALLRDLLACVLVEQSGAELILCGHITGSQRQDLQRNVSHRPALPCCHGWPLNCVCTFVAGGYSAHHGAPGCGGVGGRL